MKKRTGRASDILRDLLFPPKCVGCGQFMQPFLPDPDFLCPLCRTAFLTAGTGVRSASPAPENSPDVPLRVSLIEYRPDDPDGVPQRVVYYIKHHNDSRVFGCLGQALARTVRARLHGGTPGVPPADLICAYPPRRAVTARREGVDQAKALCRRTADCLGAPCVPLFRRVGHSRTEQKQLDAAGREAHAADVYRLDPKRAVSAAGKTVILVDDLCTTGATLKRLTGLALSAGAVRVVWATVGQTANPLDSTRCL